MADNQKLNNLIKIADELAKKNVKEDGKVKKFSYFNNKVVPTLYKIRELKEGPIKNARKGLEKKSNELDLKYKSKNSSIGNKTNLFKEINILTEEIKGTLSSEYQKNIIPKLKRYLKIFEGYKKTSHSNPKKEENKDKENLNKNAIEYTNNLINKYKNTDREFRKLQGWDTTLLYNDFKLKNDEIKKAINSLKDKLNITDN